MVSSVDFMLAHRLESLDTRNTFDVIVASEILEHVANPDQFITHCLKLLNPEGGVLFVSTINSTIAAKLLVVTMAENFLRLVPPGTHDPDRFYSPSRLIKVIREYQGEANIPVNVQEIQGVTYVPLWERWIFIPSTAANYFAIIRKEANIKM